MGGDSGQPEPSSWPPSDDTNPDQRPRRSPGRERRPGREWYPGTEWYPGEEYRPPRYGEPRSPEGPPGHYPPANGRPAQGRGRPVNGQGLDGRGGNGRGVNGQSVNGPGVSGPGIDGRRVDGHGVNGHRVNGHPPLRGDPPSRPDDYLEDWFRERPERRPRAGGYPAQGRGVPAAAGRASGVGGPLHPGPQPPAGAPARPAPPGQERDAGRTRLPDRDRRHRDRPQRGEAPVLRLPGGHRRHGLHGRRAEVRGDRGPGTGTHPHLPCHRHPRRGGDLRPGRRHAHPPGPAARHHDAGPRTLLLRHRRAGGQRLRHVRDPHRLPGGVQVSRHRGRRPRVLRDQPGPAERKMAGRDGG